MQTETSDGSSQRNERTAMIAMRPIALSIRIDFLFAIAKRFAVYVCVCVRDPRRSIRSRARALSISIRLEIADKRYWSCVHEREACYPAIEWDLSSPLTPGPSSRRRARSLSSHAINKTEHPPHAAGCSACGGQKKKEEEIC